MQLQDLLLKRRSIRKYQNKKVEHSQLKAILEAILLAPSWKNAQSSRYYICESEKSVKEIKSCLAPFNQENVKDAPIIIVSTIVAKRSGYNKDGSQTNELGDEWGFYDNGLQNMILCLKATEMGLSTLIMGIRDAEKIRTTLQIPQGEKISAVIALGYGAIDPTIPTRKKIDQIATFF